MHPKDNAIVMDFFAGSASTGHSVMELNAEDNGLRTFICVTSSENNICQEKAYPRLKNVINGYGKKLGLTHNNLRYYKTKFVPRDKSPKNLRELMKLSTDMLCIHNDAYIEKPFAGKNINKNLARYFESNDGQKRMLVIYFEDAIPAIVQLIKLNQEAMAKQAQTDSTLKKQTDGSQKKQATKLMVYVFSANGYAFDDEFEDVSDFVELCAMPDALLNAYRRVLPKRKPQLLEELQQEAENAGVSDAMMERREQDLFGFDQVHDEAKMAASEIKDHRNLNLDAANNESFNKEGGAE